MEDAAIEAIEREAHGYADIRDQRQELTREEVSRKESLLRLMKHHNKTHYHRNGITVDLVVEEETVKVRVKPVDEEKVEKAGKGEGAAEGEA